MFHKQNKFINFYSIFSFVSLSLVTSVWAEGPVPKKPEPRVRAAQSADDDVVGGAVPAPPRYAPVPQSPMPMNYRNAVPPQQPQQGGSYGASYGASYGTGSYYGVPGGGVPTYYGTPQPQGGPPSPYRNPAQAAPTASGSMDDHKYTVMGVEGGGGIPNSFYAGPILFTRIGNGQFFKLSMPVSSGGVQVIGANGELSVRTGDAQPDGATFALKLDLRGQMGGGSQNFRGLINGAMAGVLLFPLGDQCLAQIGFAVGGEASNALKNGNNDSKFENYTFGPGFSGGGSCSFVNGLHAGFTIIGISNGIRMLNKNNLTTFSSGGSTQVGIKLGEHAYLGTQLSGDWSYITAADQKNVAPTQSARTARGSASSSPAPSTDNQYKGTVGGYNLGLIGGYVF